MACSTRPGPRACVQYVEDATGVHLTARDWHHLRALAEQHEGRTFSSRYADAEEVARVAADLVAKFPGDEKAQAEFLREFSRARNTESTVAALDAMVQHDTLKDLEDRPRRVSAQQRERKAARGLSAPEDGYTTDMTPSTTPSLGDALQKVQDDYLKRMKEGYPDGELWIGGNPAQVGAAPETSPSDEGRIATMEELREGPVNAATFDYYLSRIKKVTGWAVPLLRMARNRDLTGEQLDVLSKVRERGIRQAVARNESAAPHTLMRLSKSKDERVLEMLDDNNHYRALMGWPPVDTNV